MTTALGAGVVLGVLYTLSPLTVLSLAALAALVWRLSRDMSARERSWFIGVVILAVAVRLIAIAGLFLLADPSRPYASFFGDEELFKQQTVWLRNIFLGVRISPADQIYLFDDVGRSSYLYVLAYLQTLVGDAPYGLNVLNACLYVAAIVMMAAFIRRALGSVAALTGAAILLFVPSLLSWSVSVLKEPVYILVAAVAVMCATRVIEASTYARKGLALGGVAICAWILSGLRTGGAELVLAGTAIGLPAALIATRPRLRWAAVAAIPILLLAVLHPRVQERAISTVAEGAFVHWGHLFTEGSAYRLLDRRFYDVPRSAVREMTGAEAARYTARAVGEFLTTPRPSQMRSRSMFVFLPEHALWYMQLLLLPIGAAVGLARAPVVTCMLLAHGFVAAAMVALTGGNIGTMIRHRGLTLPYFSWLAALGACAVVHWLATRAPRPLVPIHGVRHDLG
jgi:hypothetical protein